MTDEITNHFHLINELNKAQSAFNDISDRYEILHNFVRKIVKEWECDPNHASAILAEIERMEK